jgi:DNA-directed RNA polymerase I, II, and III subunit RPABC1
MELKHTCLVFLCKTEKFNIESVKYLLFQLQQHKLRHGILVYQTIITSSAKKAIDHLLDYTIEQFETKEVMYNPTKHRFYCLHERLLKEKITDELPRIGLQSLPVLLRTDTISRYFRFQKGDVIRIQRKNGAIAYRLVK